MPFSDQLGTDQPLVGRSAFRDAMARFGAAVHIITTDGPAGRAGFTASAVCSVTDEPPTMLVCLNRASSAHATFQANRVLCVNTLAHGDEAFSTLFGGGAAMADRFAAGEWNAGLTGAPVLRGAMVAFDCRIVQALPVGTHDVLICEVAALVAGPEVPGLFYLDRQYHRLGGTTPG